MNYQTISEDSMFNEPFEIPVTYNNCNLLFLSKLISRGYTHQFQVEIEGQDVFFEPDDSGSYRALMDASQQLQGKQIPTALLQAIALSIENIIK